MRLHSEKRGAGPLQIAFLHGISGSGQMYTDLADILIPKLDATAWLVDLTGHGQSRRAAPYTREVFAADVVDTLPHGIDMVVGHSLGGMVLFDAVGRLAPKRAVYLDPAWAAPPELEPLLANTANVGQHPDGSALTEAEWAPAVEVWGAKNVERARAANPQWDGSMFEDIVRMILDGTLPAEPPVVPSLVILADPTAALDADQSQNLRDLGWAVTTQPGAGHNLHLDDPDATATLNEGWLSE
jgi:pimeloyl-ACP methyl ester carboxylesterase